MSVFLIGMGVVLFAATTFRVLRWWNVVAVVGIIMLAEGVSPAATVPTQAELDAALQHAWSEWGYRDESITIKLDYLNSCVLESRPFPRVAQIVDEADETATKFTVDTSDPDADPEATVMPDSTASKHHHYTIIMNSACNWSRVDLYNTVLHEAGHFLCGLDYHSDNDKSVMYKAVKKSQHILPGDRAMMGAKL